MSDLLSSGSLQHFIQNYGLWAVFVVVMLESMGVPLPGETALVTASLYAGATNAIGPAEVIGAAAAGAIVGDNVGYAVGRTIGLPLLTRYGHYLRLDRGRLKLGQYLFLRHGGKIVFFGRFIALLRTFAALLAGANRMSWPHFLIMNALGGICWATLIGTGAYLFGERVTRVAGPIGLALLIAAVALVAAGILFLRRHERELIAHAMAALPDD